MVPNGSRTHRNGVVPNGSSDHRPLSFMAGRRLTHFFKIILPSSMADMKLRIPEKFVREFGDELSTVATLTVPSGQIWQVGLEKANENMWFHEGWQNFVEFNSIDYGHFLVFRYNGNSNFLVLLFDKTATEIQYPMNQHCQLEGQVDFMKADDAKKSRHHDKLNKNELSDSDEFSEKPKDRSEVFVRKRLTRTCSKARVLMMSRGRERAIEAARMFKPKSASFLGIFRPLKILNGYMVPSAFAANYLSPGQNVELQTSDGRQWHAKCSRSGQRANALQIGRGWTSFSRESDLKEGDVCVFELIEKKPVVLKVTIFRVVDYVHVA